VWTCLCEIGFRTNETFGTLCRVKVSSTYSYHVYFVVVFAVNGIGETAIEFFVESEFRKSNSEVVIVGIIGCEVTPVVVLVTEVVKFLVVVVSFGFRCEKDSDEKEITKKGKLS